MRTRWERLQREQLWHRPESCCSMALLKTILLPNRLRFRASARATAVRFLFRILPTLLSAEQSRSTVILPIRFPALQLAPIVARSRVPDASWACKAAPAQVAAAQSQEPFRLAPAESLNFRVELG